VLNIQLSKEIDEEAYKQSITNLQAAFNPTINSWRKNSEQSINDALEVENKTSLRFKNLISPDVNMYLAMAASIHALSQT
jgi:glutamine synthetase